MARPLAVSCGRQPDPDVGDERRSSGRTLLHDVQHVPAVQHREVRGLPGVVGEVGERPAADPLQRLLPAEAGADLERRDPEAVAVLVGEVDHEALLDHRRHQVVRRGAGQRAGAGDPVQGDRLGLSRPGSGAHAASSSPPAPDPCRRSCHSALGQGWVVPGVVPFVVVSDVAVASASGSSVRWATEVSSGDAAWRAVPVSCEVERSSFQTSGS